MVKHGDSIVQLVELSLRKNANPGEESVTFGSGASGAVIQARDITFAGSNPVRVSNNNKREQK